MTQGCQGQQRPGLTSVTCTLKEVPPICLCLQSCSEAGETAQREAVPFCIPSMAAAAMGEQNLSKTLEMFPLKKSGSQYIRRKKTTSCGTTALNADIDTNGSVTPLLGRTAWMQTVQSISDSV